MATSKLIKPTNVTVSIPAFTDQPDQRVNSNCIDKSIDGINALSDQIGTIATRLKVASTKFACLFNTTQTFTIDLEYTPSSTATANVLIINANTGIFSFIAIESANIVVRNLGTSAISSVSRNGTVLTIECAARPWGATSVLLFGI